MARIVNASIDLNKIDKARLVTVDKNGNAFKNGAKYLNVTITVNDEHDQYGNDVGISLSQTVEERQAKAKRTFIGNGKTVWKNEPVINVPPIQDDKPFPF